MQVVRKGDTVVAQHIVKLDIDGQEPCPTCPHCEEQLSQLQITVGSAQVTALVSLVIDTFSCPACGKVLSVSRR